MDESADTGHVPAEHHDERQCSFCESITPPPPPRASASRICLDHGQGSAVYQQRFRRPFLWQGRSTGQEDQSGRPSVPPVCHCHIRKPQKTPERKCVASAGHALGTDPSTIRRAALLQLVSDLDAEERILVQDAYPEETRVDGACICGHHVHSADITSARNGDSAGHLILPLLHPSRAGPILICDILFRAARPVAQTCRTY